MPVVIRTDVRKLRSTTSFTVSALFHGSVLAWVILSGTPTAQRPRSLYDQEIRPFEEKIVWYRMSDRLPEIAPDAGERRPLRARLRSPQTMVAGARDDVTPSPMIYAPEPPVPKPKPIDLPNVIAVAPPKVVRPFVAPPDVRREQRPPELAEPPRVDTKLDARPIPLEVRNPKPAPRAFVPPPETRLARQAALPLPEAPEARQMVIESNALALPPVGMRPRPRDFVPPASKQAGNTPIALPTAPEVNTSIRTPQAIALAKTFNPPPNRPVDRARPAVTADIPAIHGPAASQAEATLAIVSPKPANTREPPAPPPSRPAGFSAGPTPRKDGASASNDGKAELSIPGLTVKNSSKDSALPLPGVFSPTSHENLLAAARLAKGMGAPPPNTPPRAARVTEAPDPRLAGRAIYTVAIQMPNVTSFSGSWLVWFAERQPLPGSAPVDMQSPVPLRKVDPKYVAAAMAERVEGSVRLLGVIRRDGHVDGISLIKHLDDRLDQTAQEALSKWEFTPAMRNGVPIDVDAIFEIPFHLAPRLTK